MLKEWILESKKEEYYDLLGIDTRLFRRQRLTYMAVFGLIGVLLLVAAFLFKGVSAEAVLSLVVCPVFFYIGWKYPYYMLMNIYKRRTQLLGMLFPEFLTSFISLLHAYSGQNVINILKAASDYVKEPLRSELLMLVDRVESNPDKEAVYRAFMDLAKYVGTKEASQVMLLLYEMYEGGINEDALAELENKIERLNENKVRDIVNRKSIKLRGMSLPSLLVAVAFIFIWTGVILIAELSGAMSGIDF